MNVDAVRAALMADTRADAERLLAEADRDARDRLTRAEAEAAAVIEDARVQGNRRAAELLAAERASARREARQIVLAAQRRALDELRDRAHRAVRDLAAEDSYPDLLHRLEMLATGQLGPGAEATMDPGGEPGILASDGYRRVDYRLVTLADRAIESLGAEVETLWT